MRKQDGEESMQSYCELCPRMCQAHRIKGQIGFCGAVNQIRIGRAALHYWEEPPISGKNGSGTIFFSHCTLGCIFCQNRTISRRQAQGELISVERLAEIFLELQEQGAHNINLVTPTQYVPQIVQAVVKARLQGCQLPIVYNTSGYERMQTLQQLEGIIDIYLPDFKFYSTYYARLYANAPDYPDVVKEAIGEMIRQTGQPVFDAEGLIKRGTIVRHLMLPNCMGDTKQILRYLAEHWHEQILVSLMRQYTPFSMDTYPELNRTITDAEYAEAVSYMRMLGLGGFLQEKDAVGESFIPNFDGTGVVKN